MCRGDMSKSDEITVICKESNSSGEKLCRTIFAVLFNILFFVEVFLPIKQFWVLGTVGFISVVLSVLMQNTIKKMRTVLIFVGAFVTITGIIVQLFSKFWLNGATLMLNEIIDHWNRENGTIYYLYVTNDTNKKISLFLFSITIGIFCAVLVNLFLILRWNSAVLLLNFLFFSYYMITTSGNTIIIILLMFFLSMAYIATIDTDSALIRHSYLYWVIVSFFLIAVTGGIFMVIRLIPDETVNTVREKVVRQIENNVFGAVDLCDGDLKHINNPIGTDEVRLSLTTDSTDIIYLKGYVGASYTGNSWTDLDKKAYQGKNKDMQQYLIDNEYSPQMMLSMFFSITHAYNDETYDVEERSYSINNISASTKYIYMPYTVQRGSFAYYNNLDRDLNVKNSLLAPKKEYTFKCLEIGTFEYPGLYNNGCLTDENALKVNKLYLNYEQVYHEYADKYYRDIPENLKKYFDQNLSYEELKGTEKITDYIREYLKNTITYMDEPERNYSGEGDFIIELLDKNKQGHSVHYATAATMMFRYYGIPARYAEGYRRDFVGAKTTNLYSKDAHAWVEIYRYGMGWVPIEVTPGYYSDEPNAVPSEMEKNTIPPEPQNITEPNTSNENPYVSNEKKNQPQLHVYMILYGLLILIIIMLLIVVIRRKIILRKQRKRMQGENWRDSILFMAGLIWEICEKGFVHIDCTRLESCGEKMDEQFKKEAKIDFENILNILNRVMYSDGEKKDDDYLVVKAYMDVVRTHIYNSLSWRRKLIFKYINVLY